MTNSISLSAEDRASILVEALPYIQTFYGKTIVIKYGGNAMINEERKKQVIRDIVLMKYVGIRPVIIHGGGPDITYFLKHFGKETTFVNGLRVTDQETMDIAEMVLAGKISSDLVRHLNHEGVHAVGISGTDANLILAHKKLAQICKEHQTQKIDIGYVGEVEKINPSIIQDLLDHDYIPVISPVGTSTSHETFNINADYVAAEIAGALNAEKLLLLTDVRGVYLDYGKEDSFVSTLNKEEARNLISSGCISGGMIPKIEACVHALESGTHISCILDGRQPHALILELFTSQGIGTQITC